LYAAIDTSCFEPALPGSTGMGSILRPINGPEPALAVIWNKRLDVSSVRFGFVAVPF
jgi:hypothetical protein